MNQINRLLWAHTVTLTNMTSS
uniref:Uncharacterized protein n=1 Tax=Romanomermis culicivorax TaxID=13658 RepID=A0A915IIY9_ROMCU